MAWISDACDTQELFLPTRSQEEALPIMLSRSFMMPSALATMNATCVPTLGSPWCTSLTATGPPLNSCRLLKAVFRYARTTSQPWASHLKKWLKRSANTCPTWGSHTTLMPYGRRLQTAGQCGLMILMLVRIGAGSLHSVCQSWSQTCWPPSAKREPMLDYLSASRSSQGLTETQITSICKLSSSQMWELILWTTFRQSESC